MTVRLVETKTLRLSLKIEATNGRRPTCGRRWSREHVMRRNEPISKTVWTCMERLSVRSASLRQSPNSLRKAPFVILLKTFTG